MRDRFAADCAGARLMKILTDDASLCAGIFARTATAGGYVSIITKGKFTSGPSVHSSSFARASSVRGRVAHGQGKEF
jgi:hypothetical protein